MYSFDTVVTVRSEDKGRRILEAHPNTPKEKLSYVIVEDVAADGAFDEVSFYDHAMKPDIAQEGQSHLQRWCIVY